MCQRPSIIDKPIHYVILADAFAAKYCQTLDGKQPELQNLIPYKAIVSFFKKNNIPTLTRQELLKVCNQYKDLPYLTVTEIFSNLLTNDQSLYLPIAEADFINIGLLLNIFEKLEEYFQGVSLKVAINPMVKLAPKSTVLKWELRIDHSMASETEVATLSRKMGAAFENKLGASTIYFGKVSESLVASFIRFLDEQPQFTMSQPVFK